MRYSSFPSLMSILLAQPSLQAGLFQCKNPQGDIGSTLVLDCVEYHCIRRSGFSTEWVEKGLVENCEPMLQSNDNDASDQRNIIGTAVNGIENAFGSAWHGVGNVISTVEQGIESGLSAAGSGLSALVHHSCNVCNYGRSISSFVSEVQQHACNICSGGGGGAQPTDQGSTSYQTMKFLAKPALSLLSHEACPEHPFTCHGFVAGGKCHGICGQGHPNMTTGQAIIISATHALQYNCKQHCPGDITSPSCHQCIVSAMGFQTSGQRSWFSSAFHSVTHAVSTAAGAVASHIPSIISGVSCAVKITPKISECVSSFEGNIEGIMKCAGAASGSKDCICKVVCSVYPKGCDFCNSYGGLAGR